MADLSPAARAALEAFNDRHELCGPFDGNWVELCLAAALRTIAAQVTPVSTNRRQTEIRAEILRIADELENADD